MATMEQIASFMFWNIPWSLKNYSFNRRLLFSRWWGGGAYGSGAYDLSAYGNHAY